MQNKWFAVECLVGVEMKEEDKEQFTTMVCKDIKNAIIAFYGVGTTSEIPESSPENHKEPED